MKAEDIPESLDGHWATKDGRSMAIRYASKSRFDLAAGHVSDFALANDYYLADEGAVGFLAHQTAAKERIRWLSVQLAMANMQLSTTSNLAAMGVATADSMQECMKTVVEQRDQAIAMLDRIKKYGELANIGVWESYPPGGKKPASKDVWAFPRHMLVDLDELIEKAKK